MKVLLAAFLVVAIIVTSASALRSRQASAPDPEQRTDLRQAKQPAATMPHATRRQMLPPESIWPSRAEKGLVAPLAPDHLSGKTTATSAPSAATQLTYTFPVRFTTDGTVGAVGIGDFTGDFKADLVAAVDMNGANGRVQIIRRSAAGELIPHATYDLGGPYDQRWGGMGVGDFNGDQAMDVAVGMTYGVAMLVSGGGQLHLRKIELEQVYLGAIQQIGLLDINYDGYLDIVGMRWGSYDANSLVLFFGDGKGGMSSPRFTASPQLGWNDLKIGDVTSDGHPDLVIATGSGTGLFVVPHNGVGGFLSPVAYPQPLYGWRTDAVAIADVDSDGRADAVVNVASNVPRSALWIFPQGASGQFNAAHRVDSLDMPGSMVGADLNNDGLDDVATVHEGWGEMGFYLQMPGGGLGPEQRTPVVGLQASGADHYNRQGMAAGDFTGDGCPDIALGDYNYGLVLLEGRGCLPRKPSHVTGGNLSPRRL